MRSQRRPRATIGTRPNHIEPAGRIPSGPQRSASSKAAPEADSRRTPAKCRLAERRAGHKHEHPAQSPGHTQHPTLASVGQHLSASGQIGHLWPKLARLWARLPRNCRTWRIGHSWQNWCRTWAPRETFGRLWGNFVARRGPGRVASHDRPRQCRRQQITTPRLGCLGPFRRDAPANACGGRLPKRAVATKVAASVLWPTKVAALLPPPGPRDFGRPRALGRLEPRQGGIPLGAGLLCARSEPGVPLPGGHARGRPLKPEPR